MKKLNESDFNGTEVPCWALTCMSFCVGVLWHQSTHKCAEEGGLFNGAVGCEAAQTSAMVFMMQVPEFSVADLQSTAVIVLQLPLIFSLHSH